MKGGKGRLILLASLALSGLSQVSAEDVLTVADGLARKHLVYVYGSDDPRQGGLDCSGFVKLVFREGCGMELPDEADQQLAYCRAHGQAWDSTSGWTPATLQPGDLIFFAGPKATARVSEVSHVMIYCGNNVMVGAQAEGWQVDGTHAGVGYYPIPFRAPLGIFGEVGDRYIGYRRVFAYGRLLKSPIPASHAPVAAPAPPVASDAISRYD
jgi:hypothetical protein